MPGYYRRNQSDTPDWCVCGDCVYLTGPREQHCCRSHDCMMERMNEYGVDCITEHPAFQNVVLNPFVLETAYYSYVYASHQNRRFIRGRITTSGSRSYRYIAFRQLVRWCWGILGHGNRVDLPACAVHAIRTKFHPEY